MTTKLIRNGDGYAVPIDKTLLDELNIDAETPLELSAHGKLLVVSPSTDEKRRKKLDKALERINRKYGPALKRLAE